MTNTVYLNGEFVTKEDAKVSVLDRGFLFGDSIYEVIPVYHSKPFRLAAHLDRLNYCLNQTKIPIHNSHSQWQNLIEQVISHNGGGHLSIYIQISRGCDLIRHHVADESAAPTLLIMAMPLSPQVAALKPIQVALYNDIRWQHCDLKTTSQLGNILLRQQADSEGFDEAILHRDKIVTEATSSNVFIVKDSEIYTPKKNHHILAGITRDVIIELAENASIKVNQTTVTTDMLFEADEVWLSSSTREISPVTKINDKIVGQGIVDDGVVSITQKIHHQFQVFKNALLENNS